MEAGAAQSSATCANPPGRPSSAGGRWPLLPATARYLLLVPSAGSAQPIDA